MSKSSYRCNGQSLKSPESGGKVTCQGSKWIVDTETKCTFQCDSGSASQTSVVCKTKGWRPTHQLSCDGVSPGVIVGVLIGGLGAVIILAIIYAKYKQRKKDRLKALQKQQQMEQQANRPGRKVLVGPDVTSRPSTSSDGYDVPEAGSRKAQEVARSNNWKQSVQNKPPSYPGPQTTPHDPPSVPPHNTRRGRSADGQYQGYGSTAGGNYPETPQSYPPYNNPYAGVGYGYQGPPQAVGYYAAPESGYPASRANYGRPYHVPT